MTQDTTSRPGRIRDTQSTTPEFVVGCTEGSESLMPGQNSTVTLYLTDKTGARFWVTHCGAGYSTGEEHNLQGHLARIKAGHKAYAKCAIDRESARFVYEGPPAPTVAEIAAWLEQG